MNPILVGVVMGSSSDWDTMQHATQILQDFGIGFEAQVVSAHRMPDDMFAYAQSARERGLLILIAGAGGAAHLPGRTALRLEGVAPSVEARLKGLRELMADAGAKMEELGTLESRTFWGEVRDVAPLKAAPDAVVWKISCPPTEGPAILTRIKAERPEARAFYDWSGGLIWLALPPSDDADHRIVRGALGATGGHATLIRAPEAVRVAVPVFQPQSAALIALAARVKESFDPKGLFNPGRMG